MVKYIQFSRYNDFQDNHIKDVIISYKDGKFVAECTTFPIGISPFPSSMSYVTEIPYNLIDNWNNQEFIKFIQSNCERFSSMCDTNVVKEDTIVNWIIDVRRLKYLVRLPDGTVL